MKIVENNCGALTNYELYRILDAEATSAASERELLNGARRTVPRVSMTAQRTVTAMREQMMLHLSLSPSAAQSEEQITAFVRRVADLSLTASEVLQCINMRPEQEVELHLIVDELDKRLGEGGKLRLLDAIKACLDPGLRWQEEKAEDGEAGGGDESGVAGAGGPAAPSRFAQSDTGRRAAGGR